MVATGEEEEKGNSKNQRAIYTFGIVNAQSGKMTTRVTHYINQRMRFKTSKRDASWITDTKSCQSENERSGKSSSITWFSTRSNLRKAWRFGPTRDLSPTHTPSHFLYQQCGPGCRDPSDRFVPEPSSARSKKSKVTVVGMVVGIGFGYVFILALMFVIIFRATMKQEVDPEREDDNDGKEELEPKLVILFQTKGELSLDDVILERLLPHARGLGFKARREGFPSGAKKEWGLSPKANVRVLHTAQLDVTVSSNH
ncbi:hypothetical protein Tco_0549089 [Tanacetum coccineum]